MKIMKVKNLTKDYKYKEKDLKEVSELINSSGGFAIDNIFFND